MPELPIGTVTFFFSDIEGSTQLWERSPDAMREAVARHEALLAEGVQAHGGVVVKSRGEGDSIFAVFERAAEAVAAARCAQQALLGEAWPEEVPLRVRVALHTDEAELREGDYYGLGVNRCARVRAVGHGGQVLLTEATRAQVIDALPEGCDLRDMGVRRLKDLQRPERLYQLLHPALPAEFPPLRSLEAFSHNLPIQLTRFIGREAEMATVRRLLSETRLLTLTGTGGCGKTRLALQVAAELVDEYPDGVWLIELATLVSGELVPQSVAMALGVREEPGRPITGTLIDVLRPKRMLLILDNCEHLIDACAAFVDALLRACPGIVVLATGREALGIIGETVSRVPSLSLPPERPTTEGKGALGAPAPRTGGGADALAVSALGQGWRPSDGAAPNAFPNRERRAERRERAPVIEQFLRYEAVRLFHDRAGQSLPGFTLTPQNVGIVAQMCRQLDGIPLAIELAAARVKLLSVEQIAARLDDRFRLLTAGNRAALPRHQTLRAAIDWSHELLSEPERVLLRRLSVFVGGFSLEAAEAVCAQEDRPTTNDERPTDQALLDVGRWSLVVGRYEVLDLLGQLVDKSLVLTETVDATEAVRYRLLETIRQYAAEHLRRAGEEATTRGRHRDWFLALAEQAEPHLTGPEQARWLERLEREHENLRAALDWSAETGDGAAGLRLARALWQFWWVRGYLAEGRRRLVTFLDMAGEGATAGEPERGAPGAQRPTTGAQHPSPAIRAKSLHGAGILACDQGDYPVARAFLEESLAIKRELGDKRGTAASLNNLGHVLRLQGDYEGARRLYEESLATCRELNDRRGMAFAQSALGLVARYQGDYPTAQRFYEASLQLGRETGDPRGVAVALNNLALLAQDQGRYAEARSLYTESLAAKRELGDRRGIALSLNGLGLVDLHEGNLESAEALFAESLAIRREIGDRRGMGLSLSGLAEVARRRGDAESAAALHEESLAIRRDLGDKYGIASSLAALGTLARAQGDVERATLLYTDGLALFRDLGDRAGVVTCVEGLAAVAAARGDGMRAARLLAAAATQREAVGLVVPPCDREEQGRMLALARALLDEATFAAAWAQGSALTPDEAIGR
jgi:predicted ATPase/class 3 adenylate cyclase/Tfp pilus assembly protein PilF